MFKMAAKTEPIKVSSQFALGETYAAANNLDLALKHFIETLKIIDLQNVSNQKAGSLAQIYEQLSDNYLSQLDPRKASGLIAAVKKFFANPAWEQKAAEARAQMDTVTEDSSTMSLVEFLETPETEVVITTMALTGEYLKRNFLMTASEECLRSIQKAPCLPLHAPGRYFAQAKHTDEAITKCFTLPEFI
jgi:hypothetical protein